MISSIDFLKNSSMFLDEKNILNNYKLFRKIRVKISDKIFTEYFCKKHNLKIRNGLYLVSSKYEKYEKMFNTTTFDSKSHIYDYENRTYDYENRTYDYENQCLLTVAIIKNNQKLITLMKENEMITPDLNLEGIISLIVSNSHISTMELLETYETEYKILSKHFTKFIEEAGIQGRKDFFDWLMRHKKYIKKYDTWQTTHLSTAIAKNKWLDYAELIEDRRKMLDYLTFDEMEQHNLHFYRDKNVQAWASAIIDEKNISYYFPRSLEKVMALYPNHVDLYKNFEPLKSYHVIELNSALTVESYIKIRNVIERKIDFENANKDIFKYENIYGPYQMIKFDDMDIIYEDIKDLTVPTTMHTRMEYLVFQNKILRKINECDDSFIFNNYTDKCVESFSNKKSPYFGSFMVHFLLIGLKINRKIRKMKRFNYNIFLNVFRKLS